MMSPSQKRFSSLLTLFVLLNVIFIPSHTYAAGNEDQTFVPDLQITEFTIDRTQLEFNQKARAFVTIYNASNEYIEKSINVTLVDVWGQREIPLYNSFIESISPDSHKTVMIDIIGSDFSGQGDNQYDYRQDNSAYHIKAVVDRENVITEINEENNTSPNFQDFNIYQFRGPKADLTGEYRATPVVYREDDNNPEDEVYKIYKNQIISHGVQIKNTGDRGSILEGPVNVSITIYRVLINGQHQKVKAFSEFIDVEPLEYNESDIYTLRLTSKFRHTGEYLIVTELDGSYLFNPEKIAANNNMESTFNVEREDYKKEDRLRDNRFI